VTLYEEALPLLAALDDDCVIPIMYGLRKNEASVGALKDLATTLAAVRNFEYARSRAEEAHTLAEAVDDQLLVAHTLAAKADIELAAGRFAAAEALLSDVLPIFESLDYPFDRAVTYLMLAECARRQGLIDEAAAKLHLALELAVSVGELVVVQEIWHELAAIAVSRGQAELAAKLLGASERLRGTTGSTLWDTADFEHTLDSIRRCLGSEVFEASRSAGSKLTDEETLALARTID
jgi:tetratricopeptide (TPR) repeat protein